MKNNFIQGREALEKLAVGIHKSAEIVGGTMGTGGYNGLIQAIENPGHLLTNDGITILQNIHFADQYEEMGKNVLLESVSRSNKAGGDGSSTTCVLTDAIIGEGMKHLDNVSAMDIKRSLEACLPTIEESIKKQTKPVVVDGKIDLTLLEQVATISAEDHTIGKMIAEIYSKIGVGGVIHWDISKSFEDHYTIGKGITVDGAGFVSPYFADMDEKTGQFLNLLRWKNPKILITKQKITTAAEFEVLFKTLNDSGNREVIIFCDEFEPVVISQLVATRVQRGFKTALVKMPTLWKDWWYVDLAKATGATVIDQASGITFKTMNASHLGTCESIVVDKENAYLDGIADLSAHIKELEDENTDDSKLRASRLNTQTARYFVGAPSDSALSYRRLKVEDAIHSAYYALKDGIVAGGAISLREAAHTLDLDTVGANILLSALRVPMMKIMQNAGASEGEKNALLAKSGSYGYDSNSKQFVNMFEAGIVDTSSIVLNAVRNAISVAASILTSGVVISFPRPDITEQLLQEIMTRK